VSLLTGKEKEIIAMRDGGNALINDLFQAKLNDEIKANARPDCHTDLEQRSKFIYDKYQHRKWYSVTAYNKLQVRKKADIAISKLNQNSISEMEEDFFASRGNIGNSNSFVSGNDEKEWWKIESDNNDNATDGLKKSKKNHTKASSGNRRNLMSTLQMESKSKLLDDIAYLGTSSNNDEKKTKPSDIKRNASLKKGSENGRHRTRRDSIKKEQGITNGAPSVRSRSRKAPSKSRSGGSFGGGDSFNGSIKEQENTNDAPSVRRRSRKAPSRSRSGESSGGNDSFNDSIKEQENTNDAPSVRRRSRKAPSRSRSGESSGGNDSFSDMSGGRRSGKEGAIKDGMSQITKEQEGKKVSSSDKPHRQNTLGNSKSKINDDDDSRIMTQSEDIRRHKNGRKETTSSGKPHRRKPPPGRSKSNSVVSDALVTNRMRNMFSDNPTIDLSSGSHSNSGEGKSEPNNDSGTSRPRPSRGVKKSKSYDISMDSNRNQCAQRTVDNLSASGVESESIAKEQEHNSLSNNSSRSSSVRNGDRKPRKKESIDEEKSLVAHNLPRIVKVDMIGTEKLQQN
jgi:hypothetical protein